MNFLRRIRSNSMVIAPLVELVRGLHSSGKSTKKHMQKVPHCHRQSTIVVRSIFLYLCDSSKFCFFHIECWVSHICRCSTDKRKTPAPQYFSLSCILSTYKFIVVSTFIFKTACLLDKWFFRLGAMQTEKGQTHSTSERKSWKWWQLESDIRVYYSPRSNVAWVCGINGVLCANRAYEYEEEEGRSAAGA